MKVLRISLVLALVAGGGAMSGCISPAEREEAVEKLAMEARARAYDAAYKEAVDRGLESAVAKKIAEKAAELAYRTAKEAAAKVPSSGALGQILTTIFYSLVQFGLPLLAKKGDGA